MQQVTRMCRARVGKVTAVLALGATLAACDSLLNVDLPGQVTEEGTFLPENARLVVNSAIADTECALSAFVAFEGAGYEDTTTRTVGWYGGRFERPVTPSTSGNCAGAQENTTGAWFAQLHKARWMAEQVYARMDTLWNDTQVPDREELMATADIYAGIAYTHFGEFFCEVTADSGPLMSWSESLQKGEALFTDALTHIDATPNQDFPIATGVTTSAKEMAYLLRARARFAQNTPATDALAAQDAAEVTQGFIANVTRDGGAVRSRWNRVYSAHVGLGWVVLLGPVTWWSGTAGADDLFNPWPAVIPYTGYWDLAVLPDGRAVSDAGDPVTLADAGSVADPRVPAAQVPAAGITSNPNNYPSWEERKYTSQDDDIPLAKWEEAWLIQAQVAWENGDGPGAISLVNDIRTADGLPTIQASYLDGTDLDAVRNMLLEEIRRTHFLEPGRWWSTKLRYNLWFPRNQGQDQWNFGYQSGVRMVFPDAEFTQNPNLTQDDQGSLCPPYQDPTT